MAHLASQPVVILDSSRSHGNTRRVVERIVAGNPVEIVDRLADLVTVREDLGRLLPGKAIALVATGTSPRLPPGFQAPFRHAGEYLGKRYAGAFYWQFSESDRPFPHLAANARRIGAKWIS